MLVRRVFSSPRCLVLAFIVPAILFVVFAFVYMGQQTSTSSYKNGAPPKDKVIKPESEWKKILTKEQYKVCREKGTERAFTGKYHDYHESTGLFSCVGCGQLLFNASEKFDSGTGWPSFWQPATKEAIQYHEDKKIPFMTRVEVTCSKCDAHLGHVFDDGPAPTHQRYCINSVCLKLEKEEDS